MPRETGTWRDNWRMADEPEGDDLVELGGRTVPLPGWLSSRLPGRRPSRGAGALVVAALVVGLAAGYAAGDQHARGGVAFRGPTATASSSSSPAPGPVATFSFANSPGLTQDTGACSAQSGQQLELGIQVTNQSAEVLTLQTVKAVLPLGGLKQVAWQWATCGEIPNGLGQAAFVLLPGESTWLSVMFQVKLHCPAALPVQFSVSYLFQGHTVTASLPGFPDLGQVPYSGCGTTGR
jgi:hypothetical protein